MTGIGDLTSQVVTVVAGAAAVLSSMADATGHARDWPASYRRATGALMAVSGTAAAAGLIAWLVTADLAPMRGEGAVIAALAAFAAAVAVYGTVRALRAGVDPDVKQVHAIAEAMEEALTRSEKADGFDGARCVPLMAESDVRGVRRTLPLAAALRRGDSPLTILSGPPGAGKSVALREVAREQCRAVRRSRRPRHIALYIDLRTLRPPAGEVTADLIWHHVRETVASGNSRIAGYLDDHLRQPRDRPEWLFLFDSFDDLPALWDPMTGDSAASAYMGAIQQFLMSVPGFCAVIAVRESSGPLTAGRSVTVAPLDSERQRMFAQAYGLDKVARGRLFAALDRDPPLLRAAENPLLLGLLCDHLKGDAAEEVPSTLYEVVGATVVGRLRSLPDLSLSVQEVRRIAEDITYCMATRPWIGLEASRPALRAELAGDRLETTARLDVVMDALIEARIARASRGDGFVFVHRGFQDYFATGWLLREGSSGNVGWVVADPRWQEPAVAALRLGSDSLRRGLIETAATAFRGAVTEAPGVVTDVVRLLDVGPKQALSIPATFFTVPQTAIRVGHVLVAGLCEGPRPASQMIPPEVRDASDLLLVSAFAGGALSGQQQAVTLLPLGTPEVGEWAVGRVMAAGSRELRRRVTEQLAALPVVFDGLRPEARLKVVNTAASARLLFDRVLLSAATVRPASTSLPEVMRDLVRVLQIFALSLGTRTAAALIAEITGPRRAGLVEADLAIIAMTVAFLYGSGAPRQRMRNVTGVPLFWTMAVAVVVAGIVAATATVAMIGVVLHGDIVTAANDAGTAYLFSWALVMAAYVVISQPQNRWEWVFPQVPVARIVATHFEGRITPRGVLIDIVGVVRSLLPIAAFFGLLWYAASGPLPSFVPNRSTETAREALTISLFLILFFGSSFVGRLRWYVERRRIRRKVIRGEINNDGLLDLLLRTTTRDATARLIKELRQAPPTRLMPALGALADLDAALGQVVRMVPAETRKEIPPGVWDFGVTFLSAGFRQWLIKYDERYPGRLSWLAAGDRYRDDVATAVNRARQTGL